MSERSEPSPPRPPGRAKRAILLAGGGTGGHVIPLLAVARELRRRGLEVFFVGTERGIEARLVPEAGFPLELIRIGGLKGVSGTQRLKTLWQLPMSILQGTGLIRIRRVGAVFSMGGYTAGPSVMAALIRRIPVVLMEPNAVPGFTNRHLGRFVRRALISFQETARFFPKGRTEVTGLPVREEFFGLAAKPREESLTVLVTGGSQGSRTLNEAARGSWKLFREAGFPVSMTLQTGRGRHNELAAEFAGTGLAGKVVPFIADMAAAFAESDLIICRSGAGAVAELAAAGKPSVLVPFPFATDDHQLRNAEAFVRAGAARLVRDHEMTGEKLFQTVRELASGPGLLPRMGEAAGRLAQPGAARRAADILEELAHV